MQAVDNKPVLLLSIMSPTSLGLALENGYVRKQRHPFLPLTIYNYTEKAQFENVWDEVTTVCRGLIVDDNGIVVARPFNKFHNLNTANRPETHEANLPNRPPVILEKLDGFLAIYWEYEHEGVMYRGIASRGSFTSEHSQWATTWYVNHYGDVQWPEGWTPVFEGIHPAFRIVCKYDEAGLILTGMVDKATGRELDYWAMYRYAATNRVNVVKRHEKSLSQIVKENRPNHEGYVLTWHDGNKPPLKVKVKHEEYVRLHRVVTGMNVKTVWEMLSNDEDMALEHILNDSTYPKEFREWLANTRNDLLVIFYILKGRAERTYEMRPRPDGKLAENRKENALYFRAENPELASVCFAMLDGKDYEPIIWKLLKPKNAETTFRKDGDV